MPKSSKRVPHGDTRRTRSIAGWLAFEASLFYRSSLASRYLGRWDDAVLLLQRAPLGMFFYNQRLLVLFASGLFLSLFYVLSLFLSLPDTTRHALWLLSAVWLVDVMISFRLHSSFRETLRSWNRTSEERNLTPNFDRYFLLDGVLLFLPFAAGRILSLVHSPAPLPLDGFIFLLLANNIVYAAYVGSRHRHNPAVTAALLSLFVLTVVAALTGSRFRSQDWSNHVLIIAPVVATLVVTIASIATIWWLHAIEHAVSRGHLELLGDFERDLSSRESREASDSEPIASLDAERERWRIENYRKRLQTVLERLCRLGPPLWYATACVWFLGDHRDRGPVLVPGSRFGFKVPYGSEKGINAESDFLQVGRVLLVNSLRHQHHGQEAVWNFDLDLDAPAAIVPLLKAGSAIGFLVLYGSPGGASVYAHEEAFLRSLGEIVVNTMEQWHGRFHALSRAAMDRLFSADSLTAAFDSAAGLLTDFLSAEGCMLIYRADPSAPHMEVVSSRGFRGLERMPYTVGDGQTGRCAALQEVIRFDDVHEHRSEFDESQLARIEKAHGKKIRSWLAIPIGDKHRKNYGVIKLVNSRFGFEWFTDEDVTFGQDLALRLHVIIEHFQRLGRLERMTAAAEESAAVAARQQAEAERAARARQQDLLTITHTLQGAFIAIMNHLSSIERKEVSPAAQTLVDSAQAFGEDGLTMVYGITTALAAEAGQETDLAPTAVNAPEELRKLAERLRATNSRADLKFSYFAKPGFPSLTIDSNVFTTVIFNLIHNAMKYADRHTTVMLECSFERRSGEAALKVKSIGEPIDPDEADRVFDKFFRGRNVRRGRRHTGVGLGLWVARKLMQASNGDLTLELSSAEPRLSVFIVHIHQDFATGDR